MNVLSLNREIAQTWRARAANQPQAPLSAKELEAAAAVIILALEAGCDANHALRWAELRAWPDENEQAAIWRRVDAILRGWA